ncbi:MAG TPA: response regulator [Candidatus Dormibacteraeota bacterium]|nr:response regulator [Candidatus Dormibacteraeota bacterium]
MTKNTSNSTLQKTLQKTIWDPSVPLRVLLIEHSTPDAKLNLHELKRAGFRCQPKIISRRAEFLDQLKRFSYDLVLADYRLPDWTGLDAYLAMRHAGRDAPFILVAGALGEETAIECIRRGVTDFVLKDHLARLPIVVARALEEKSLRDARTFMVESLRQSEANSLFLFAHNPLPMWVLERESLRIIQVNDAAICHYGYKYIDFLNMKFSDLHPDDEVPRLRTTFQGESPQMVQTGQWHHRLKDGSEIDVEIFLHKMEYSGLPSALLVAQDITERKRTEEERQKFFTLVENCRDFIAVADLLGHVVYVNPAGRGLLGIENLEATKGTSTPDYIAIDDQALLRDTVYPALLSAGHWEGELRFRHLRTGQPLPMDFVGFQVKDTQTGEPRFVATVSRDMSERRALEQQLQQAQKFEAIGQLAGGIAHDFNNVIGAILGWAELGEEQSASIQGPIPNYFKKIHLQCDRVTALIRQLLAFARRQILEPRNFSLNQTVQDVLNLPDKVIGKDVEIKTDLAKDLSAVRADPTQVEQVILNLCINSRDAMPKGGCLTIQTRNAEFSEEKCRLIPGFQAGHYAEMCVSDTGCGMEASVRERIFEPFFTTKGMGKGSGLGLATAYGIVKQHGGCIQVESEPGRGSTFRVLLPVSGISEKVKSAPPVAADLAPQGGTETILIVEDHEGIREMAETVLKSLGYRVMLASDGQQAVSMFSEYRDVISLVLLDVIMPHFTGLEAYAAITALKPDVCIIFATGYSNEQALLAKIAERGIFLLHKPYSPKALGRRVRQVLDQAASMRALQA